VTRAAPTVAPTLAPPVALACALLCLAGCAGEQTAPPPEPAPITAERVSADHQELQRRLLAEALDAARQLQVATDALLAEPTPTALRIAQGAWLTARAPWGRLVAVRDWARSPEAEANRRALDHWPADPDGLGYPGLELLLWGEGDSPRVAEDFSAGSLANHRRLTEAAQGLVQTLESLPEPTTTSPARILVCMAAGADRLAHTLAQALADGDPNLLPSIRSRETHQDLLYGVQGALDAYWGSTGGFRGQGPGHLLETQAPDLDSAIQDDLRLAEQSIRVLQPPVDPACAAGEQDPQRLHLVGLRGHLERLAGRLREGAAALRAAE
jgi:Imelysin